VATQQPPIGPGKSPDDSPTANQNATAGVSEPGKDLPSVKGSDPEFVNLPLGTQLDDAAALDVAKSRPTEWIVLAGPTDSGKTTLLTSLYELFQWNKVKGYAFAGSDTLPAFEECCYLSRRNSGGSVPLTQRTKYDSNPKYLHLKVRSTGGLRLFMDFLFTDVSGEMFDHARDSVDECKEMHFLKRARHFLLFLDSAKGVQQDERWETVENGKALLRSCMYSEMIWQNCVVNVVWSRFDYFIANEAEPGHKVFRNQVEVEFRKTFAQLGSRLKFCEIAARPLEVPTLHMGHGVQALLDQWAAVPLEMKARDLFPTSFSGTRESELFAPRHFAPAMDHDESDR
jgi:energy-coupling factor transporter ATP-binding protein EcfA2